MPKRSLFSGFYESRHRSFHLFGIPSSQTEMRDILKAWIAVSFIFAFIRMRSTLGSNFFSLLFTTGFVREIVLAGTTVGIGFLLHEMAHKIVAQKYGCAAEFRSDDMMLLLALVLSIFVGFVFIAPGATMIAGRVTKEQSGKIALAGPITNLAIAFAFALIALIPFAIAQEMASIGYTINVWLAVFNLIPFFILDGKKVWDWNKGIWLATLIVAGIMMFSPWPKAAF